MYLNGNILPFTYNLKNIEIFKINYFIFYYQNVENILHSDLIHYIYMFTVFNDLLCNNTDKRALKYIVYSLEY